MKERPFVEIPMVLKGAKLHAELNREYETGYRDAARVGFLIGLLAMAIQDVLIGIAWFVWGF